MSELAGPLRDVLEETGYLTNGAPAAPSVALAGAENHLPLPSFKPDAWWCSKPDPAPWAGRADLKVYFKFVEERMPFRWRSGSRRSGIRASAHCCGWYHRSASKSTTGLDALKGRPAPNETDSTPFDSSTTSWSASIGWPGGWLWRPVNSGGSNRA